MTTVPTINGPTINGPTTNGPTFTADAAEVIVDLDAIAANTELLARTAASAQVMSVVKADGYGHGAVPVARTVLDAGATQLGVATISEALELRESGITAPVAAWLHSSGRDLAEQFALAAQADVELAISTADQLAAVVHAAQRADKRITLTVKVDTGLQRNGAPPDQWPELFAAVASAQRSGHVEMHAIMSHLACSDEPGDPSIDLQNAALDTACEVASSVGCEYQATHIANSAAIVTRPDLHRDIVRPGIATYGLRPLPVGISNDVCDQLVPAMSLRARVALTKHVAAGEGVSYGYLWRAPQDTTVALIPLGYADGLPRLLSNRFEVSIAGRRYRAVGRVCMDQFVVDLGPEATAVKIGDLALLFGAGTEGEPLAQDWADAIGTIHYEIVCGVRGRVVRRYTGGGLS